MPRRGLCIHPFRLAVWVAFSAAACGGVANDTYLEPVLVLRGTVTDDGAVHADDHVRAALVWKFPDTAIAVPDEGYAKVPGHKVASETTVRAEFPSQFELHVVDPPPEAAFGAQPGGMAALAALCIYKDGNGNQALDFVDNTATPSPDTVLWHSELRSWWVVFAPARNSEFLPGFQIWQRPTPEAERECQRAYECDAHCFGDWNDCSEHFVDSYYCRAQYGRCLGAAERLFRIEEPLTIHLLPVAPDGVEQLFLCNDPESYTSPMHHYDPTTWPPATEVTCSEGGLHYRATYDDCEPVRSCAPPADAQPCFDVSAVWAFDRPVPDYWPCPVDP